MSRTHRISRASLAIVLSLPGLGLALWIVPRTDPHATAGIAIKRIEAKETAQAVARDLCLSVEGWTSFVAVRRNEPWRRVLDTVKTPAVAEKVPPFSINVLLLSPDRSEFFEAILAPQGQMVGHRSRCDVREPGGAELSDVRTQAERALGRWLNQGFRQRQALQAQVAAVEAGQTGQGFHATLLHDDYPDVEFLLAIRVENGQITEEVIEAKVTAYHWPYNVASSQIAKAIRLALTTIFMLVLLVFGLDYIRRLGDGEVAWARCVRLILFLLAAFVAVGLLASDHWFIEGLDVLETLEAFGFGLSNPHTYFERGWTVVPAFAGALLLGLAWCRCESAAREHFNGKWTPLDALLAGNVLSHNAAKAFLVGLALAGWVISLPNLVWLLPWSDPVAMGPGLDRLDNLLMKMPALAALVMPLASTIPLALLGLFAPLAYLRRQTGSTRAALWILAAGLSFYFVYDSVMSVGFDAPLPAAILVAVLKSATFLLPFIWFDVLTAFFAVLSARVISLLIYLHHQPSEALQGAGDWGIGIIAVTAIGALWILLSQEALSDEDVRPRYVKNLQKRREREAELEHFHAARSRLLPRQEPNVSATKIASWARPAHFRGADFHDFFTLEGGRVGILMAELGGQPFEGALAIPLIKGFLISHTRRHSDPERIVRDLKESLTLPTTALKSLAFSTFDPATGAFRSAWHVARPPILLWCARTRKAVFLSGPEGVAQDVDEEQEIHLEPGDGLLLGTNRVFTLMDPKVRARELLWLFGIVVGRLSFDPQRSLSLFRFFAGLTGSLVMLRREQGVVERK